MLGLVCLMKVFSFEENSSFREKLFLNKLSFEVEGVMYQKESLVSSLNLTAYTDDVVEQCWVFIEISFYYKTI